jgi:hypothetical protein
MRIPLHQSANQYDSGTRSQPENSLHIINVASVLVMKQKKKMVKICEASQNGST